MLSIPRCTDKHKKNPGAKGCEKNNFTSFKAVLNLFSRDLKQGSYNLKVLKNEAKTFNAF